MNDDAMCYVAADPSQPGAAWGATVDRPEMKASNAKCIARWVKEGANVERVSVERAREMLAAWVRPTKPPFEAMGLNPLPLFPSIKRIEP